MKDILIYIFYRNSVQGNILKYHLGSNGFNHVRHFTTPDDCLYAIQRINHPDFIILVPGESVVESLKLIQLVRQIDGMIDVIVYATNHDETNSIDFLNAGASDYIVRSGNHQNSLRELVANLQFILKEKNY